MPAFVCPWWGGYFIDNRLRRLLHNPEKIVGPYIKSGMTVMDVGCGMGLFSIAMAKMVGDSGNVIAVDLQQKMLDVMQERAEKAGVSNRIRLHRCQPDCLGVEGPVDFALAFAMVHEVPDQWRLLTEIRACLKPDGKFLVAEPRLHVPGRAYAEMVRTAGEVGLKVVEAPRVLLCRAAVMSRV